MSKIRIYELARELGTDNKSLERVVRSLGIEIKNYMSTVSVDEAARIRQKVGGAVPVEAPIKKAKSKVIRRRATGPSPSEKLELEEAAEHEAEVEASHSSVIVRSGERGDSNATGSMRSGQVVTSPSTSISLEEAGVEPRRRVRSQVSETTRSTASVESGSTFDSYTQPGTTRADSSDDYSVRSPSESALASTGRSFSPASDSKGSRAPSPADTSHLSASSHHSPSSDREISGENQNVQSASSLQSQVSSQLSSSTPSMTSSEGELSARSSASISSTTVGAGPGPRSGLGSLGKTSSERIRTSVETNVNAPLPDPRGRIAERKGPRSHMTNGGSGSTDESTFVDRSTSSARGKVEVGTRIELPKGTRRLRGGLADRLERQVPEAETGLRAQTSVQSQEELVSPGADTMTGTGPPESNIVGESLDPERQEKPSGRRARTASIPTDGDDEADRQVVRDSDGVIVAAARKKSEPKILGFINIEPRRRQQQVIITEAAQPSKQGRASARKKREERSQQQGRRRNLAARTKRRDVKRPGGSRSTVEMSEAKKRLRVNEAIQVSDLAHQMGVKASRIIRSLWTMGMRGTTINGAVDVETAELVAAEFGYTVENVSFDEEEFVGVVENEDEGDLRAPVVVVMGHVDHGKTTLLDFIRRANVADKEAGGITQHVGAYRVASKAGPIVFLDTPGHQAFMSMRSRGASITDILVLVVAADDGVMPTTLEAIQHAKDADIPIVVAINKIDKPEANPGRVKQMLMNEGLVGEEFGGDTPIVEISAKTGEGIEAMLELLAVQAEVLDLRASEEGRAVGTVIESRLEKGRGAVVLVLNESGMIKRSDLIVAGEYSGKIRGLFDDHGKPIEMAGPSMPVEILGLDGVPSAGDKYYVVDSEKSVKQLLSHRREQRRRRDSVRVSPSALERLKRKKDLCLKVVLRTDVAGSAEALKQALEGLSTEKVRVEVIFDGVGAINETDIKFANAGDAIVIGFNTKPVGKAMQAAESTKVKVFLFKVIYEAEDRVKELMIDLLPPEYQEKDQGEAEVRQLFPIPRLGLVCGCRVVKGSVSRNSHVRVRRGSDIVHTGKIASLRVFKEDVREVKEGFECGIVVENFVDIEPGDILEAFELETLRPTL